MEENTNPELTDKTPTPADYYSEKSRKKRDFWIGFISSILGNLALVSLYILTMNALQTARLDSTSALAPVAGAVAGLLPWTLNIAAIAISLIMRRRFITFGILASYGAVLALSIIAGIVLTIWCFASANYI